MGTGGGDAGINFASKYADPAALCFQTVTEELLDKDGRSRVFCNGTIGVAIGSAVMCSEGNPMKSLLAALAVSAVLLPSTAFAREIMVVFHYAAADGRTEIVGGNLSRLNPHLDMAGCRSAINDLPAGFTRSAKRALNQPEGMRLIKTTCEYADEMVRN